MKTLKVDNCKKFVDEHYMFMKTHIHGNAFLNLEDFNKAYREFETSCMKKYNITEDDLKEYFHSKMDI